MKYVSELKELENKKFDSVEELEKAEEEIKTALAKKEEAKALVAKESADVQDAFKARNAARRSYNEKLVEARKVYNEALKKAKEEFNGKTLPGFENSKRPIIINNFMPKNERKQLLNKIQNSQNQMYSFGMSSSPATPPYPLKRWYSLL